MAKGKCYFSTAVVEAPMAMQLHET